MSCCGCLQKVCVLDFEVCNEGVTRKSTSKWRHVPGTDFLDTPLWSRVWARHPNRTNTGAAAVAISSHRILSHTNGYVWKLSTHSGTPPKLGNHAGDRTFLESHVLSILPLSTFWDTPKYCSSNVLDKRRVLLKFLCLTLSWFRVLVFAHGYLLSSIVRIPVLRPLKRL